ncbi:hypothetical protein VTN96DRAFT_1997 [Rasamsonia emersonii]
MSFLGEDPLVPGYRPLYWTLFGGANGRELRSLTAISVNMLEYRMGVYYNHEEDPRIVFHLGYDPSIPNLWEFSDRGNFSVDGQMGKLLMLYMLLSNTILMMKPVTDTSVKGFHNVICFYESW